MSFLDQHVFPLVNDAILGASMDRIRAEVASGAHGSVLEIGAGTGLNARHYPADARVRGIEPSAGMRGRAADRLHAPSVRASVQIEDGRAEALPFDAGSFDCVLFTFVLCSVKDVSSVLREARRVLRPGGALRLVEHVKSPNASIAAWQSRLRPLWMTLLGGCDPTREVRLDLERSGFDVAGVRSVELPLPRLASAGILGEAIRI